MSGPYSFGYRRDPEHRRTQKDAKLMFVAALPALPDAVDHAPLCFRPILDQNRCGSCTGHGTAQGLYVSFQLEDDPLGFVPSPKHTYALTRAVERASATADGVTLPSFTDSGGMPSDIAVAVSTYGIDKMQAPSPQGFNTDVDPSNVNDEVSFADLEEGFTNLVVGEYRIDEQAADWSTQIANVLAFGGSKSKGAAVGCGFFVDSAFMNWAPGAPLDGVCDTNDPNGGGHWVTIIGYRKAAGGSFIFKIVNSWTDQWGDQGFIEVTEAWLKTSVFDLYPWTVVRKAVV